MQASVRGHMRIPGNEEAKTKKYPPQELSNWIKTKALKMRK
jgi:hypothetical protein